MSDLSECIPALGDAIDRVSTRFSLGRGVSSLDLTNNDFNR